MRGEENSTYTQNGRAFLSVRKKKEKKEKEKMLKKWWLPSVNHPKRFSLYIFWKMKREWKKKSQKSACLSQDRWKIASRHTWNTTKCGFWSLPFSDEGEKNKNLNKFDDSVEDFLWMKRSRDQQQRNRNMKNGDICAPFRGSFLTCRSKRIGNFYDVDSKTRESFAIFIVPLMKLNWDNIFFCFSQ